jgi:hypothetical protein
MLVAIGPVKFLGILGEGIENKQMRGHGTLLSRMRAM